MASKLRPLYDRLYIRVETRLQARAAIRDNKKYARAVTPPAALDEEYRAVVRPYWRRFRVAVPGKYSFRLFCNADKGLDAHLDPRYIPDDLWLDRIIPHYNNLIFAKAMQDKCVQNVLFPDVAHPVTVVKCIAGVFYDDDLNLLTREQAAARVPGHGRVIIKPSVNSGQGHDIRFFDTDGMTPEQAEAIFDQYGKNFIIQEKMAQHEALARLNPGSLNTIRIITFLYGGQVRVLSACLRVGGADSEVDNCSQGGLAYIIERDGTLQKKGFTHQNGRWAYPETLPTGEPLYGFAVPGYAEAERTVCTLAARMSHVRIIGWDLAISPAGEPVLVEFNAIPGCNQECDLPTFGDLTEEVLTEVFGRRA